MNKDLRVRIPGKPRALQRESRVFDKFAPANVSMILDLCSKKPQVTRARMTAEGISLAWPVSAVSSGRELTDTSIC